MNERDRAIFGLKPVGQDFTEIEHYLSRAYKEKNIQMRQAFLHKAEESLAQTYQDPFLVKTMRELKDVTNKQIEYFKKSSGEAKLVDQPLGDLIFYFVGHNNDKMDTESRNLKRAQELNE